jgi:hypothetical protein
VRELPHWGSPQELVSACAEQFNLDKWEHQDVYCEVFIEKDALVGVIEGVCEELDVPYLACRGYASASELWRAGHDRIKPRAEAGKNIFVFYLGDHDPSGIDMTRDVKYRLELFSGSKVCVQRLALNADQIKKYRPPPNPTKLTDSRAREYVEKFGKSCYELDALEPAVIVKLIRDAVSSVRDKGLWDDVVAEEKQKREQLKLVSKNWRSVVLKLMDGGK